MGVRSTKLTLRAPLLVEAPASHADAGARRTMRWRCHRLLDVATGITNFSCRRSGLLSFRALHFLGGCWTFDPATAGASSFKGVRLS